MFAVNLENNYSPYLRSIKNSLVALLGQWLKVAICDFAFPDYKSHISTIPTHSDRAFCHSAHA